MENSKIAGNCFEQLDDRFLNIYYQVALHHLNIHTEVRLGVPKDCLERFDQVMKPTVDSWRRIIEMCDAEIQYRKAFKFLLHDL